jgi:hypothetical protein
MRVKSSRVPEFQSSRVPEFQSSRVPDISLIKIMKLWNNGTLEHLNF